MQKGVFLVLTSAIAIDGELVVPKRPDGKPTIIEVSEHEAKNFLHRGKARLATEADMPPAEPPAAPAPAEPEAQAAAEQPAAPPDPAPAPAPAGKRK